MVYGFFVTGFRYIHATVEAELQMLIRFYIYEMFLAVMMLIMAVSALISNVFSLYRGTYDALIVSSPSYKKLPLLVLMRSTISSSWPLYIVFVPALIALIKVYSVPVFGIVCMFLAIVLLLLLVVGSVALGVLVFGIIFSYCAKKLHKKITFTSFAWSLACVILLISIPLSYKTSSVDLVKLFRAEQVDVDVTKDMISSSFKHLPSHYVARSMSSGEQGEYQEIVTPFVYLITSLLLVYLGIFLLKDTYYPLWLLFQDGRSVSSPQNILNKKTYFFTGNASLVVFKKELLVFTRNTKGILWLLFLMLIWVAEIALTKSVGGTAHRYGESIIDKTHILQTFQFGVILYFICSFTLRFVFPSFSMEKKTSWILKSSPSNIKTLFFGKYAFFVTAFLFLGIIMMETSMMLLRLPLQASLITLLLFISTLFLIITFGLCLGVLFPIEDSDDPEIISTSMPGLLFTGISLAYVALGSLALYQYIHYHVIAYSIVLFLLSSIVTLLLLRFTVPKLHYRDSI
jgi:hypothetical protein